MKKCVCTINRKCFYCETREHWDKLTDEQREAGIKLSSALRMHMTDKPTLRAAIQKANELKVDLKMIPLEMF